jgi:hypothetical protein
MLWHGFTLLLLTFADDNLALVCLAFFTGHCLSWLHRDKHSKELLVVFQLPPPPLQWTHADRLVGRGLWPPLDRVSSCCWFSFGVLLVDWTVNNEDWNSPKELFLNKSMYVSLVLLTIFLPSLWSVGDKGG